MCAKVSLESKSFKGRRKDICIARVYDIVDAGPRHRFLTANHLVHNCLGLGYGASHEPFIRIAKTMAGLDLSETEAKRIVQDYRRTNWRIVQLWRNLDRAFKASRGEDFEMELPSGRTITYFSVNPKGWKASVTLGGPPRRFWGSKIFENLIQAAARDVFAEGMLRLIKKGYAVIWHCHDEVIVEADQNDTSAIHEIPHLMSIAPGWLRGCPLAAEAAEANAYRK